MLLAIYVLSILVLNTVYSIICLCLWARYLNKNVKAKEIILKFQIHCYALKKKLNLTACRKIMGTLILYFFNVVNLT